MGEYAEQESWDDDEDRERVDLKSLIRQIHNRPANTSQRAVCSNCNVTHIRQGDLRKYSIYGACSACGWNMKYNSEFRP